MKLVVFERRKGWYWRLVARNNRILAIGGEPFSSARAAKRSFTNLRDLFEWARHRQSIWIGGIQFVEVPLRKGRRRR